MARVESEKERLVIAALSKADESLRGGDLEAAERAIINIPSGVTDLAIGLARGRAIEVQDVDIEAFYRALQIQDRLVMYAAGTSYPDKPLFFVWKASLREIDTYWQKMTTLRETMLYGPEVFIEEINKMNLYEADATLKLANLDMGLAVLRDLMEPSIDKKREIVIKAELTSRLAKRAARLSGDN